MEPHTNLTVRGSKETQGGTLPTHHTWHETTEITHGVDEWFETGFYIFTSHLLPAVDLNRGENWEFSLGVGVGMTQATDHLLVKMIVGYRFGRRRR